MIRPLLALLLIFAGCSSAPTRTDPADPTQPAAAEARDGTDDTETVVEIAEEDVEFVSAGATLRGTIVSPRGATEERRGVVIVHDVGPIGRDGVILDTFAVSLPVEVPVYRAIANHLASRGFVVLIYDKRTCVQGSAPWCTYPRSHVDEAPSLGEALVSDALAAAEFLERRDDVADGAVDFVGHGQGAKVATVAATQRDGSRIAMLAPSAHALDDIVLWQSRRSIELLEGRIAAVGDTPEADLLKKQVGPLKEQLATQAAAFARLRSDEPVKEDLLGLPTETWRSYFAMHALYLDALRRNTVSALAILADADQNHPPESVGRMQTIMAAQGDERFVLVTELTHPMVGIGRQDDPTVVSPIVLDLLTEFLDGP